MADPERMVSRVDTTRPAEATAGTSRGVTVPQQETVATARLAATPARLAAEEDPTAVAAVIRVAAATNSHQSTGHRCAPEALCAHRVLRDFFIC